MPEERCDPSLVGSIDEDFQSFEDFDDITLEGWTNAPVQGSRLWKADEFSGNVSAKATAFNDTSQDMESWLITTGINMADGATTLSFRSQVGFPVAGHNGLEVYISEDYNGFDVQGATWNAVNCNLADGNTTQFEWIESGDVDLSGYSGKIHIAFVYKGSGPDGQTASYYLDDIVVE